MPLIESLKLHYFRTKKFYLRYERWLMPGALVAGFLIDYITFTNIKVSTAFAILLLYWLLAGLTIVFSHLYDAGKVNQKFKYARLFAPLVLQFFFGALLGGSFVFYWFSGSFSASWPFILILVALMISNDVFRDYFIKPILQLGVYFFVSFSLFSVVFPFLFNSLSAWLFVLAGAVSLIVIYAYMRILIRVSAEVKDTQVPIWSVVLSVLLLMNILYFTNVIPPIPLSIREAGMYHLVEKRGAEYVLTGEAESFLDKLIPGQILNLLPGERAYAFTAVFAPAELNVAIEHQWEYYNEDIGSWVERDRLSFVITGGRNAGYRGYTWKSNLTPGAWRVSVKTPRGQVLGGIKFKINHVERPVELVETIR